MVLNNNDGAARAESIHAQQGLTSEIDLYPELIAFAKLSPEEQSRLGTRSVQSSEPENTENRAPIETIESKSEPVGIETPSAELVAKNNPPEFVATQSQSEPAVEKQVSSALGDLPFTTVTPPQPNDAVSDFNLPHEIVYTGTMSPGVCLACGEESDSDDLFCLSCGGFVDEVVSAPQSVPLCKGCKHRIDPDEIFCPWCGFSAPAGT